MSPSSHLSPSLPLSEPSEVALTVDGKMDLCSRGVDINFNHIGFSIYGQAITYLLYMSRAGVIIQHMIVAQSASCVLQFAMSCVPIPHFIATTLLQNIDQILAQMCTLIVCSLILCCKIIA